MTEYPTAKLRSTEMSSVADSHQAPTPQPERTEPRLSDPRLRDMTRDDVVAIAKRAVKEALDDGITDGAAALAYYIFLAIPAALLLALGVFGLLAGPDAVDSIVDRLATVVPDEAVTLVRDSLDRLVQNEGGSVALVSVGAVLALWTLTGAMTALMRALNRAYDREETRGFVRQRLAALAMLALALFALLLTLGLLVLGPHVSDWVGEATGLESVVGWIWWTAQWPILIAGLLISFASILYLGPNVAHPRWQFVTPGAVVAIVVWLGASALFALYTSMFSSYNKTWGTAAAVVVTLVWLWLSSLALLFGAEVNAEAERSRELRRAEPAEQELQAPAKA
jgi:membrane protein